MNFSEEEALAQNLYLQFCLAEQEALGGRSPGQTEWTKLKPALWKVWLRFAHKVSQRDDFGHSIAEREACASVAEQHFSTACIGQEIAEKIRARGQAACVAHLDAVVNRMTPEEHAGEAKSP